MDPSPAREQEPDRERQRVTPNPPVHGNSVTATPTPGEHVPGNFINLELDGVPFVVKFHSCIIFLFTENYLEPGDPTSQLYEST